MFSQISSPHPLIEGWMPSHPVLKKALCDYCHQADIYAQKNNAPSPWDPYLVDIGHLDGLDCVNCVAAEPHTDKGHSPWFVMWILRCHGHILYSSRCDDSQKVGQSAKEFIANPEEQISLQTGQIIILSSHHAHWLLNPSLPHHSQWPWDDDKEDGEHLQVRDILSPYIFVAASVDTLTRPDSKTAAEEMVVKSIQFFNKPA
jgi:hypothetical protein